MSIWTSANAAILRTFGRSVSHWPLNATPYQLTAVRGSHGPLESESLASFERVWAPAAYFLVAPVEGDTITIDGQSYTVHSSRHDTSPDSDGLTVYLSRDTNA